MSLSSVWPQFLHTNILLSNVWFVFVPQIEHNYLWRVKDQWLRQFYWKKRKRLLWTHGYYVGTLGQVSEKIVWSYIEHQGRKTIL